MFEPSTIGAVSRIIHDEKANYITAAPLLAYYNLWLYNELQNELQNL